MALTSGRVMAPTFLQVIERVHALRLNWGWICVELVTLWKKEG
jgi:hypothetical protein